MLIRLPLKESLPAYYQTYYKHVGGKDLLHSLSNQIDEFAAAYTIPEQKESFAYATDKWTIREVIGHLIDTERIFSYRILRLARRDATPMAGFDENEYARNSRYGAVPVTDLLGQWKSVRHSVVLLLENLDDSSLDFQGTANGLPVTARMLAFMVYAHAAHHLEVISTRYLAD